MISRIKVVHIVTRLDLGGAQLNTLYTVQNLKSSRFEVILASGAGGILLEYPERYGRKKKREHSYRLEYFPDLVREINFWHDLRACYKLWRFLRKEKPVIVHTHSSKAGILGRFAAKLAGIPVIIHTYHGFGFHDGQLVRRFFIFLERVCCHFSTKIIFVSEANRSYAKQINLIRPGQDELIRSGIRLDRYPPEQPVNKALVKKDLKCPMHKPMIVSIGNTKPQKNPEGFMHVAKLCLREFPEASFVFIGNGDRKSRLEAELLHSPELTGKVRFLGWQRDIPKILAAADIFILTSLWEGLPRALVEAMKTGLPCVCYATDGIQDLIEDGKNGYLIRKGVEEEMASRIVYLLKNPDEAKVLGQEAAKSIKQEFSIDRMVQQQEDLYDRLWSQYNHHNPPKSSPLMKTGCPA